VEPSTELAKADRAGRRQLWWDRGPDGHGPIDGGLESRDFVRYSTVVARRGPVVGRRLNGEGCRGAGFGVGVGAVYGSYFGAGLGVLLLALLGILIADDLQRHNALKGLLSLLINVVGVVVFLVSTHVRWGYVAVLAVTAYVGAIGGVAVARRLPPAVMRALVVGTGTVVGVVLLVR